MHGGLYRHGAAELQGERVTVRGEPHQARRRHVRRERDLPVGVPVPLGEEHAGEVDQVMACGVGDGAARRGERVSR